MPIFSPDYETLSLVFEEVLKNKDPYDHHGRNVSNMLMEMIKIAGCFSEHETEMIKWGAFLHDIGKVFIPDSILNKAGKLTAHEIESVRTHTVMGYDIARKINCDSIILNIIRYHHENLNGTGYHKLKGDDIPIYVKWVRVVDTWDAMSNERIYRKPATNSEIFMFLDAETGTIFDADAVHFLKLAIAERERKK